jgi:metal-sulfur cluster biosynthetic enzyme
MEYLRSVIDPEIYQSIVDLGLVYGVDVADDNSVDVRMTLTTPHCPMGPQIIGDVEQTLLAKGASRVTVTVVWEPMWTPDAMTDDLKRELGMLEDEEELPIAEMDDLPTPLPEAPKKKGLLSRIFGF